MSSSTFKKTLVRGHPQKRKLPDPTKPIAPPRTLTAEAVKAFYFKRNYARQHLRTNLYALCHLLGYKDVDPVVHGPLLDNLQKFRGGEDVEVSPENFEYRPHVPHWQLEGARDHLFLYPRGHLKTTIISIAHTIQWIVNYPNIRVCISTSIGEQMELVLGALLQHFRYNQNFRLYFPEFCPPDHAAADWGNMRQFTVPNRTDYTLKEPTVWTCSVGKVNASFRADVTKHSDLVNEQNVKTPGGIREVIEHHGHFEPIVERYSARDNFPASHGWTDVEGTRYDFGDLYGLLLKDSNVVPIVESAIREDGSVLWPARFPLEELERIRRKPSVGDTLFSSQYLNKCIPEGTGLADPRDVVFVPDAHIRAILPRLRLQCVVDLAGMEQSKGGDDTAITVLGFDSDGRAYVPDIYAGRFSPEEVISLLFLIRKQYPQLILYKMEKEAHARVLLPFLKREESKRNTYLNILPLKRDTHQSKQHRIRGLRPWFQAQLLRFSDAIPLQTRHKLLDQIAQFPSESAGVHDDILDTLADAMQDGDGGVTSDVIADPDDRTLRQFGVRPPQSKFIGFGENGEMLWSDGSQEGGTPHMRQYMPTGIM